MSKVVSDKSTPQTKHEKKEGEFSLRAMPTFSPFHLISKRAITRKTNDGKRDYTSYEVVVEPINHVGKKATFLMFSSILDKLEAVIYLAKSDANPNPVIEAEWSPTTREPTFSARAEV